ncbi:MAG TPA: pyridoxamine 5'-phosphate oxidase [Gemmatimonadaceae bacterium]
MATVRPLLDPIALFQRLLAEAEALPRERLPEPTALALATANQEGQPSVRMVLLKNVDERGFVFFTNLESRKSRDLSFNRRAAMCFHWAPLERQVRVEGVIAPVSVEEADEYFASRARMSQLGAWASRQSRTMEAPGDLDERVAEYEAKFEGQKVPRPPFWSGFRLTPETIEFWYGKPNRLHDRQLYLRDGSGWRVQRLYP